MHFLTKQTLENTEVAIIRQRQTKQRYATICVRPHYKPPSTQNVNMTRTLLQTTGSKDVPNIIFMWKP